MDDVFRVCCLESPARLTHDVDGLLGSEFLVAQERLQVLALHILHGDELGVAGNSQVENADDVAVRDLPRQDQLAFEPLQDLGVTRQLGADHF